ncbi:MAG: hypothetical protein EZS28_002863, partial [Streblomastix strix]
RKSSNFSSQLSGSEYQLTVDDQNSLIFEPIDNIQNYAMKLETNENSANGDFTFSAESGTVWMYDQNWYNSGDIVPDQVTPASDTTPKVSIVGGVVGTSTEYARGDNQHPLQVSDVLPAEDTANTYARSDHIHHVNLSRSVPKRYTGTGTAGISNVYARSEHQHPLNVVSTTANVPLVNATAAANGTSDYYCRSDHVHPQQLTYTGPLTSIMFIRSDTQATDVLPANGDSKPISDIAGDVFVKISGQSEYSVAGKLKLTDSTESFDDLAINQYTTKCTVQMAFVKKSGKTLQEIQGVLRHSGDNEEESDDEDYLPRGKNLSQRKNTLTICLNAGNPTSFACIISGNIQINPTATSYDDELRITRSNQDTGNATIQLGCSRTSNTGAILGQWSIFTPSSSSINNPQGFAIAVSSQAGDNTRGLQISANGNTLKFNERAL